MSPTRPTAEQLRPLAAPAAAVLLLVLCAWFLRDSPSRNDSQRAGTEAAAAACDSIMAMGSYQPDDAERNLTAARDRLTGDFLDAYTQAIQTVVIPNARQKRMSSAVTVPAAGVVEAHPDRVVLLAYVDQTLTIAGEKPTGNPSRYRVTMDKVDGRWLIAGFDQI